MRSRKAVIGISTCRTSRNGNEYDSVSRYYSEAVAYVSNAIPLGIPSLGDKLDSDELLEQIDGLLFTGSPSNVDPGHYGGAPSEQGTLHDPARDATTLPLIQKALDQKIPFLAICRGFQELNVALGGTLHQKVQDVPGKMDHRADYEAPIAERFALAHEVELAPAGILFNLIGKSKVQVNSVHAQGVDRLGEGLLAEAYAPDGLVEAVSVSGASAFALAVQWHPEWNVSDNELSNAIFSAFGEACRERANRR
ncbi:gamma-glutamyl-gamma-aminobutyrate hydrolase family protein [Kiloniella laminariae]|uniref:Gamma-glutamyl-gamma-aminobutyrate hydrolase family protein n=1 Tax=Kiloniella laminariae TaxID=454162 RepID=A0ABT4LNV4_9PROT|nr:gamma-glutamyl-gamma-aminobutyrate hydrolase family protein [Kiloniella laminariae]MCZ4282793.1 gamma-glutamyl-gamma-aminobutyrate hydrolase family protein [Kiloniella laminariae]